MNPINHFDQNRPVHLARRDVFFEKAAEMISSLPNHPFGQEARSDDFEELLPVLRVSREHARFAVRSTGKNSQDEQFSRFINLLAGNVKAVLSMINLKGMVEDADESSFSFLGVNQASAGLQAEEYQRRANDIIRSIQNTLKLACEPFEELKEENRRASTKDENLRYEKAREHFLIRLSHGDCRYSPRTVRKMLRFAPSKTIPDQTCD